MTFTARGEPICDSCGDSFPGTVTQAMVRGWGYWKGQVGDGSEQEHIICRTCRTTERKKTRTVQGFEDEPLF